ncbi:MAG: enoyl-ACP reductase [Alphaproteobacteria bacterium]|nr:enoyl-ACP reductase [Alphaproteobacteria bacterium]
MRGKRGIVMGVANDHSIAWLIAKHLHAAGAEVLYTCQNDLFRKRLEKLTQTLDLPGGMPTIHAVDVQNDAEVAAFAETLGEQGEGIDFLVHALAWSEKSELQGRYLDTSKKNFIESMVISCFSFTGIINAIEPHLNDGASLLTLTFEGASRVVPNYNVMGVAKAALESSVRYLATDLGTRGIRVNAISAGPMRTLAGAAISGGRFTYGWQRDHAPLLRAVTGDDVGGAAVYLLSDMSTAVTGEIHFVDAGFHTIGMVNVHSSLLAQAAE